MKDGIILTILVILWTVIKLAFKLIWAIVKVLAALIIFFGLYIPLFYVVFGLILLATTDFTLGGMGTDQVLYYIGLGLCCVASIFISIRNFIIRPLSAVFAPFFEYRDDVKKAKDKISGKKEEADEENDRRDPPYRDRGYDPYYGRDAYPPRYPNDYAPYYDDRRVPYREDPQAPYYGQSDDRYYQGNAYRRSDYGERTSAPYDDLRAREDYSAYGGGYGRSDYSGRSGMRPPMPERPLIYYSKRRPGVLVKEYSDRFELFEESEEGGRYIGTEYKDE